MSKRRTWVPLSPTRWIHARHGTHVYKQHVVAVMPERDQWREGETATLCGMFLGSGYGRAYHGEIMGTGQPPLVTIKPKEGLPVCDSYSGRLARIEKAA